MENIGEIDTKPIDSVQAAISLFGAKSDQKKKMHTSSNGCENERELEEVIKDLANYKVQLEAKDAAYMQALLKLEQQQKAIDELSMLLKSAEIDRDKYVNECSEARVQPDELKLKLNEMTDQCLETVKVREQLLVALSELKIRRAELLSIETELAATRESELKGILRIELRENTAYLEKEKAIDLIRHLSEPNETIVMSKVAVIEAEEEMSAALSERDAGLELATEKVGKMQNQLEKMSKQREMMDDLESQLLAKTLYADVLELALKQTKELECSYEKASSDDLSGLKQLEADFEVRDIKSSDQALYIESLEMELNQLKVELKNANEKFKGEVETLADWLEKMKLEMDEIKERETGAQIEIALLKSELHKGRSKIASAEAAEARAESVKSSLYLAVRDLAVEADEVKKENIKLKQGPCGVYEQTEDSVYAKLLFEKTAPGIEEPQFDILKTEASERRDEVATITISLKEYQSLIENVDRTSIPLAEDSCHLTKSDCADELEKLKRELEAAAIRIGEFRTRAEQAVTRAEMAEKAKGAVEDQLRKWREQKQKRKAAHAAMKEVSAPKQYDPPMDYRNSTIYQPLGQVLNIKF